MTQERRPSLRRNTERWTASNKTLGGELVTSILAGLIATFIPISIASYINERNDAIESTQERLVERGALVHLGVTKWLKNLSSMLDVVSYALPIRKLDREETQMVFSRLAIVYPYRSWRLWDRNGNLVAGTDVLRRDSSKRELSRLTFLQSRQGQSSFAIQKECLSGKPCYDESIPVYAPTEHGETSGKTSPIGVLSISIALEDTAKDAGLAGTHRQVEGSDNIHNNGVDLDTPVIRPLSLQNNRFTGEEVMIVSREGNVIFPISTVNDEISLQEPGEIAKSKWGPFVNAGIQAQDRAMLQTIGSDGKEFFAYTRRIDGQWSLVAIVDKESSLKSTYDKIRIMAGYQLLTLVGAVIAVLIASRKFSKRLELAAAAIRRFSVGDFEARVISEREGAIGKLYCDINQTGSKLRDLLNDQLAHARTDEQIQTAAGIQKSFINDTLPVSATIELAGAFEPAYEIGADWYDAVRLGGITYIIIADVCDKGIGSALFMSVFRSLIRFSILVGDGNRLEQKQDIPTMLGDILAQVNDYMATNHGMATMFATVFLAAYEEGSQEISYVCAGHERPLIIRSKGVIDELETTGPAVGVFIGTQYKARTTELLPEQILFTYTDGLVDARSPDNRAWGIDAVKTQLASIDPRWTSADSLLRQVAMTVDTHRGEADQFDDLTMLIMKVRRQDERSDAYHESSIERVGHKFQMI